MTLEWDVEHRIVAYDHPQHGIFVACYMPAVGRKKPDRPRDALQMRLRYQAALSHFLAQHRLRVRLVLGDMNVAAATVDCSTGDEWGKYFLDFDYTTKAPGDWQRRAQTLQACHKELLERSGLVDAWRARHDEQSFTSFQVVNSYALKGWKARVDLVLVPVAQLAGADARIFSEIEANQVPRKSDHVPVGVRLVL